MHQHVLWGLDDGPGNAEEMHALICQSTQAGIQLIAATTHAYPAVRPFPMERYLERLEQARAYCRAQNLQLEIIRGSEIRYCDRVPDLLADGELLALGNSRYVLIEFNPDSTIDEIDRAANRLYQLGYQPVVAHVERYRCLMRSPRRAIRAKEDCSLIYQMNCESVLEPRGLFQRSFVRRMLEEHAIDVLATDAHDTVRRPVRMKEAYRRIRTLYGNEYAKQLLQFGWKLLKNPSGGAT